MHIGLIYYGDLSIRTGGFLYDRKLVEGLSLRGDRISLFPLPWQTYPAHILDNFRGDLLERLRADPPNLILQDELNHPSLFLQNQRIRIQFQLPICSIIHHLRISEENPAILQWLYRQIERSYLESVDGWICNSQSTLEAAQNLTKRPPKAIIAYPGRDHIQPAISDVEISERAVAPGPLRLLFLGSVIQRKGLEILIQAVRDLPIGSWQLEIIGDDRIDPSLTARIQSKIHDLGLQNRIRWHGTLGDEEISTFLSTSHVLAVPSVFEGYGIVFLEAMGYGVVPIASYAGGPPELIDHGTNGFLVSPGDSSTLHQHLLLLNRDRQLLAKMAVQARERYLAQPTWGQTAASIQAFLHDFRNQIPSK